MAESGSKMAVARRARLHGTHLAVYQCTAETVRLLEIYIYIYILLNSRYTVSCERVGLVRVRGSIYREHRSINGAAVKYYN